MPEMSKQQILDQLEPLIKQAENEKKWLFCSYQCLWFSPKELRQAHKEGRFIWGAVNWKLRSPKEYLREMRDKYIRSKTAYENFENTLKNEGYL